MKKAILLILTLSSPALLFGEWHPVTGSPEITLLNTDSSGIDIKINIPNIEITPLSQSNIPNEIMWKHISIPNEFTYTTEEGKPELPILKVIVAIPDSVEINLSLSSSDYSTFSCIPYPVPKKVPKRDEQGMMYIDEEFFVDESFYKIHPLNPPPAGENHRPFYPEEVVKIDEIGYIRDQRIVRIVISPLQYNPDEKLLRFYHNLQIRVNYTGIPTINTKGIGPFERIFSKTILNYKQLQGDSISNRLPLQIRTGTVTYPTVLKTDNSADYLIITSDEFYEHGSTTVFARWRAEYNQFDVAVVNLSKIYNEFPPPNGTDTCSAIRSFIEYAYDNWSAPSFEDNHVGYLLFLGNANQIPIKTFNIFIFNREEVQIRDRWFVEIKGGDSYADIMMGRFLARDSDELSVEIDKTVTTERTPTYGTWGNNVLIIRGLWNDSHYEDTKNQIKACGFNLFEVDSQGGTGTTNDVINYWNEGVLIIVYDGHATCDGWPIFTRWDVSSLDNGYKLPFVLSGGCRAGLFGSIKTVTTYFSEQLLFEEGGGANAFTGETILTSEGFAYNYIEKFFPTIYNFSGSSTTSFILGDIFYAAISGLNLYGDPALRMQRFPILPDKAELEISNFDISVEPVYPRRDELSKIKVKVHNLTDVLVKDVLVNFYLENGTPTLIGSTTINLPSRGSNLAEIYWRFSDYGNYNISVRVDPYNQIPESSEINNHGYYAVHVNFYQKNWPQDTLNRNEYTGNIILTGDLDNDGYVEIIFCTNKDNLYVWNKDGELLWEDKLKFSSPVVGDLDGDGNSEIVGIESDRIKIYFYDGRKDELSLNGYTGQTSPALGDLDGDGDLEIIGGFYSSEKGYFVSAFHHDGREVSGWPQIVSGQIIVNQVLADLDRDGTLEILAGDEEGNLYIWHGDGSIFPPWPKKIPVNAYTPGLSAPSVGDLDGDNELEIVVIGRRDSKDMFAFEYNGGTMTGWPKYLWGGTCVETLLGDMNRDKKTDIVLKLGGRETICSFNYKGDTLASWQTRELGELLNCLIDIDNDTYPDILTWHCNHRTAYSYKGVFIQDFLLPPNISFAYYKTTDVIADIDGDGDIEIISGASNQVYIWDYWGSCTAGTVMWPMSNHDMRRTNCYDTDIIRPDRIDDLQGKNPTFTSIDLCWTATGDDWDIGTATVYYIRYATFTITPDNWYLANRATCTITPQLAGTQEFFTVNGLAPDTNYYFAIRVRDDEFNTSPLSNIVSARTLSLGSQISLTKSVSCNYILPNGTVTYTISYKNMGVSTATDVIIIEALPAGAVLVGEANSSPSAEVSYWYDGAWQDKPGIGTTIIKWRIKSPVAPDDTGNVSFTIRAE